MRDAAPRRPALPAQNLEGAHVLDEAVAQRAVGLQTVAVRPHAAVAEEIAGVLVREQVLARRHRPVVVAREHGLELEIERVACLLVPEHAVGVQRLRVGDRGVEEPAVRVDRDAGRRAHHLDRRLKPAQVLVERGAADLHLADRVAPVEVAPELVLQTFQAFLRIVVAAGRVDEDALVDGAAAVAFAEEPIERLLLDFRDRVPDRHVEHADRDRALAVPAWLLVLHQAGPGLVRVEVLPRLVEKRVRIRALQARDEALAQEPARRVAAVRVEAEADDRPAVADHVRDHGDDAHGHLAEVDIRVAQRRPDRHHGLAHVGDRDRGAVPENGRRGAHQATFSRASAWGAVARARQRSVRRSAASKSSASWATSRSTGITAPMPPTPCPADQMSRQALASFLSMFMAGAGPSGSSPARTRLWRMKLPCTPETAGV